MRITFIIISIQLSCSALLLANSGLAQTITIDARNINVKQVFKSIEKQASVSFVCDDKLLEGLPPLTLKASNTPLPQVLSQIEKQVPLRFKQSGTLIGVSKSPIKIKPPQVKPEKTFSENLLPRNLNGKVLDEQGTPLSGATIKVKDTNLAATTNTEGQFTFDNLKDNAVLIISYIGYDTKEVTATDNLIIVLIKSTSKLDEVHVIAYGTTTQRLKTGAINKVSSSDIAEQPVGNPLAALEGRVPGLTIVQANGIPGSSYKVQVRGQNALDIGNARLTVNSDPLFIIDGVPFAPNNGNINTLTSALTIKSGQGLSPFNTINPDDIESIEVLKDADATAIYGSRGANGVILITTKKGVKGKPKLTLNIYNGMSRITNSLEYLNTQQYLQMRTTAFRNDGVAPTTTNAPELTVFDQNSYTDFKKLLFGGTAHSTDATASVTGGSENTNFLISGSYRNETTVFPGDMADDRESFHFNFNHISPDQKFSATMSLSYAYDKNNIVSFNPVSYVTLAPDYPSLYDVNGNPAWDYKGVQLDNPIGGLFQAYTASTKNLMSNLQLNYKVWKGISLKSSFGYNDVSGDEVNVIPIISVNPLFGSGTGGSYFGNNKISSWIIEPQAEYKGKLGAGDLNVLAGGTWQQNVNSSFSLLAKGYPSDALLTTLSGSTTITRNSSSDAQYRYQAFFGRINYNLNNEYLINITGRRDGSSRFGPDKRFANFGAIGAAWIFSNEALLKNALTVISFGKIRASYGVTGSDQINDYQFLDTYTPTTNPYQGISGLYPTKLANPDYQWEENRKIDIGLDLGLDHDRFYISADYFRNRSSNHLISYPLPTQTGFTSILENFPALIQNTGVELSISSKNFTGERFKWETNFNISFPKNKLVSFPGIETSSYASYSVGESLSTIKGYELLGVNPGTGVYNFRDVNNDGLINTNDQSIIGNLDPKYYGGINNTLNYKVWTLTFFFEFKKQLGINALSAASQGGTPGTMNNIPSLILSNVWQNPGDQSKYQQLTTTSSTAAYKAGANFVQSSGVYTDASYLRLKTLSLSYNLPQKWLSKIKVTGCRFYVQGQNLFTVTNYFGNDPETQTQIGVPPLKTLTAGIQLNL